MTWGYQYTCPLVRSLCYQLLQSSERHFWEGSHSSKRQGGYQLDIICLGTSHWSFKQNERVWLGRPQCLQHWPVKGTRALLEDILTPVAISAAY